MDALVVQQPHAHALRLPFRFSAAVEDGATVMDDKLSEG
jgi:hypothetical protein